MIAISEDDDKVVLDAAAHPIGTPPEHPRTGTVPGPERLLVLGTSPRLPLVLRELDTFVAPGSQALVFGERDPAGVVQDLAGDLNALDVTCVRGDVTDRTVLESLNIVEFDHVLLLSETEGRTQEMADARTTVALLYLRDLEKTGSAVPITSEILEIESRDLASVAEADDFIISNRLISLLVSQVAENPHLVTVFDQLLNAGGHELHLRPVDGYWPEGEVTYRELCEAAMWRGEVAIGYRSAGDAQDADRSFGVVVNPPKSTRLTPAPDDRLIGLAEN